MKIGLSYAPQIQALPGGGFIAQEHQHLVAGISAGYHQEHEDDDRHKTINATGSISERGRDVPIGEWQDAPFLAGNFTGSGTMTWTQPAATASLRYSLIGKTVTVGFEFTGATIGGGLGGTLFARLPDESFQPAVTRRNLYMLVDNGAFAVGVVIVVAGTRALLFQRLDQTAFAASAALTALVGELVYEVR